MESLLEPLIVTSSAVIVLFALVKTARSVIHLIRSRKPNNRYRTEVDLTSGYKHFVRITLRVSDSNRVIPVAKVTPVRSVVTKSTQRALKALYRSIRSNPENHDDSTVVGMMLGRKVRAGFNASLILIGAALLHNLAWLLGWTELSGIGLGVIALALIAIELDQHLVEYRIKKHLYGTNAYEAREIIRFILEHSNPDDFNQSGYLKKLAPDHERDAKSPLKGSLDGAPT